jgi:hypothetical protein
MAGKATKRSTQERTLNTEKKIDKLIQNSHRLV